jgi:hypothetical protein
MTFVTQQRMISLVDNSFEMDFLRVKLIKNGGDRETVYRGSGSIAQKNNGGFLLKVYHLFDSTDETINAINEGFDENKLQLGKIIDADQYFDFEGIDLAGDRCISRGLKIDRQVSLSANAAIFTSELQRLESKRGISTGGPASPSRIQVFLPGNYNIPFYVYKHDERGIPELTLICELSAFGKPYILKQYEKYTEISAELSDEVDPEEFLNLTLTALGIAIGCQLQPRLIKIFRLQDETQVMLSWSNGAGRTISAPIPISRPNDAVFLQEFFSKFVYELKQDYECLAGYWYRVLLSASIDFENRALILTVSIEGVLKHYYAERLKPDEDFLRQIAEAVLMVTDICIGVRAKKLLLSTLSNSKDTPKNGLHNLCKNCLISEKMISSWTKLRNKSTHPKKLIFEVKKIQPFADDFYTCLELFYRLVFIKIGYTGDVIRYGTRGWPTEPFTFNKSPTSSTN